MKFSRRQVATMLASLRLWQRQVSDKPGSGVPGDIAMHFTESKPLTSAEIDKLCEAINIDHQDDINARREKIDVALGDMARGEDDASR